VSFAAITLCVASQRVFIFVAVVVVYFVIDSVRKLLDKPSDVFLSHDAIHEGVKTYVNCIILTIKLHHSETNEIRYLN
jgi:heme/copper-type cytochrome/quinol oxidase subunit 2